MVTKRKQKRLSKKRTLKKEISDENKNDYISNNRDKRKFN